MPSSSKVSSNRPTLLEPSLGFMLLTDKDFPSVYRPVRYDVHIFSRMLIETTVTAADVASHYQR